MVRVLKTIGFDARFTRGKGAHLWDAGGARYLDLVSGWGVFAIGRNHPHVAAALKSVLDADLPNLVQMDVSPLAGAPRRAAAASARPGCKRRSSPIPAPRRSKRRSNSPAPRPAGPAIVHCEHSFHGLTYGALSAVGDKLYRDGFGPVLPDFREIPFDDLAALERALRAPRRRRLPGRADPGQGRAPALARLSARGARALPQVRRRC